MKTSTFFALMAEYSTASVELDKVCEKYFGLKPPEAAKRANLNRLPVPTFRCGTQKSAFMVHVEDLANLIDAQREKALEQWQKMNG
ncbi:pyocin activator protein PrtN [Methylobacter tundripaludum]|uniref:Pyocin activator protein PrtN n=1 Tax=Methylobacter tundripaludum TaxID=173365 RepID=A0A2S6H573_9GAMM|nr:pyocin activator PrtN family protein [Methylobacter tundripaludum]PPK72639.1 pyocin activator protein PrtN [Methylobacter tundripaludum]